ncbi:MAG TPA: bacteriohopanetetrol glucosamine biosynthesis glycosyltransferase HpnI [Xanthobacteraceae bacterium]
MSRCIAANFASDMHASDITSLLVALCDICLVGAFVGCLFTLLEAWFVLRFPGEQVPSVCPQSPVTVLKPLHGTEPDLAARLARFCEQDYAAPVQLVFGARDETAPAVAVARKLAADFPDKAIDVVVDVRRHGGNRKVCNLINMLPAARHDTVVLSDSDILVEPDYLRDVTALLAPSRVGAVTCLYYGIGNGLWGRLSALATNAHFLPQAIAASGLGLEQPCCGATIALQRSMLDRIGSFGAFADMLADDYAIGAAIRSLGYDVVTAPFLVGHRCFEDSLYRLILHQLRAARTIRSIEPVGYAGSIITHPFALALVGLLSGSSTAALLVAAAFTSRLALCRCVERRFRLPRQSYWLIPLHDVVAFAVYVASFFGANVNWQGADYRVTADGKLVERKA